MDKEAVQVIELISESEHLSLIKCEIEGIQCTCIGIPENNAKGELEVIPLAVVLNDEIIEKLKIIGSV